MKQVKYLLFILSLALVVSSCESDPNGRMPDDIMDSNCGVVIVTASDPFINVSDPGAYSLSLDVDLLFEGDFQKIEIAVVMNGDYENQYVLDEVTSVPQSFTYTTADFAAVITELASVNDIVEGDQFNVFANITLADGTYLPAYHADGVSTLAPSVRNIMGILHEGAAGNVAIPVPCAFDKNDYLGAKAVTEYWDPDTYYYGVNVIEDPDYTGEHVGIIVQGLFTGTWEVKLELSLYDYSISAIPAAQVMAPSIWGYGNPTWTNITGTVNTCEKSFVFYVGSMCVDEGCFGGMPLTYTVYDDTSKGESPVEMDSPEDRTPRSIE